MALTNPLYLIQKAAEAYERYNEEYKNIEKQQYWLGQAVAYESLFNNVFESDDLDEVILKMAKLVFTERMTYDSALAKVA